MKERLETAGNISTTEVTIGSQYSVSALLPRILPFAVFMAFVGIDEFAGILNKYGIIHLDRLLPFILYPLKALITTAILLFFRSHYCEVRIGDLAKVRDSLLSVLCGLAVFVAWVHLDFSMGVVGPGFNPTVIDNSLARWLVISIRLAGAALIVPIMEELFWRSFLLRFLISKEFSNIPIGYFTWSSFLIGSILFGLEHNLVIAGIMAGAAYNLLLYRTKSISQCILAHGITNFALGIYVFFTGQWQFW